jgi:hypothetical protein
VKMKPLHEVLRAGAKKIVKSVNVRQQNHGSNTYAVQSRLRRMETILAEKASMPKDMRDLVETVIKTDTKTLSTTTDAKNVNHHTMTLMERLIPAEVQAVRQVTDPSAAAELELDQRYPLLTLIANASAFPDLRPVRFKHYFHLLNNQKDQAA